MNSVFFFNLYFCTILIISFKYFRWTSLIKNSRIQNRAFHILFEPIEGVGAQQIIVGSGWVINIFSKMSVNHVGGVENFNQMSNWHYMSSLIWPNSLYSGSIVMLCRNPTLNSRDFFDKTFEEYKNGFAANGNFVSTMLYQTMWRWIRQCNTLWDNLTLYQTLQHFVREWITLSENALLCRGGLAWTWKTAPAHKEWNVSTQGFAEWIFLKELYIYISSSNWRLSSWTGAGMITSATGTG